MSQVIKFKDFNFKLAVVNNIIENSGKFKLDSFEFAENYTKRDIAIDAEGYDIIPEIKEYYENIEVLESDVQNIEEICQDGGDDIYMTLCPFWSGEDEIFDITSVEDVMHLPKLKNITLFYQDDDAIIADFKAKNITAEWL